MRTSPSATSPYPAPVITPITRACFCPVAIMTTASETAMAVPTSAERLTKKFGNGLEAGRELGDGLELPVVAVGLQQVGRLGPEPDGPVVAHDRIDVGGEVLAALEGGEEALPAEVLPRRLQHCADDLGQAPFRQPDVVALPAVVLLVRLLG